MLFRNELSSLAEVSLYSLANKVNLVHNLFLVYLTINFSDNFLRIF